ncbi:MAG: hypothetical protein KKA79_09990 [Nanoarchaeota archaeon]|nr:hypothetical protein [Nanoarchaeota archaeon]MCG2717983.1 hypothetical protein [Nanoarchaeota archaeon]
MKIYKKFKGMSKSKKIGLVSAAVYTSSLALPVYGAIEVVQQKPVEPINIEHVVTAEQARELYKEKINEYSIDKKLHHQEIKNLYVIVEKGIVLEESDEKQKSDEYWQRNSDVYGKILGLDRDLKYLENPTDKINDEINYAKYKLNLIDEHIKEEPKNKEVFVNHKESLAKIKDTLNNLIQVYYPGLLKSSRTDYNNLHFSVNEGLVGNLEEKLLPLIKEADQIFQMVFDSYDINQFRHSNLSIQDIVSLREVLKLPMKAKEYIPVDYSKKRAEQIILINQLTEKAIKAGQEYNSQHEEMKVKLDNLKREYEVIKGKKFVYNEFFEEKKNTFKSYVDVFGEIDKLLEKYEGVNKYWADSMVLSDIKYDSNINDEGYDFKDEIKDLEEMLKEDGFDLKVEGFNNPTRTKFPLWATWPLAVAFEGIRRLLISRYVIRRELDIFDCAETVVVSGFLAPFFFDGLHPLVFPLRMFAMPFIEEPLRKYMGWTVPRK